MEKIEKSAGNLIKRRRIQDGLLLAVYASAGLALVLTAPGAERLLKHIDPDIVKKRNPARRMSQTVSRLVKNGYIERLTASVGQTRLKLTKKGEDRVKYLRASGRMEISKPKRWDKRWRIVMFDIWERQKPARDRLRSVLQRVGFVKVQNSVWIYPYDCEELLVLIRTDLKLGKHVLYFVAAGVENDEEFRKHFNLSNK